METSLQLSERNQIINDLNSHNPYFSGNFFATEVELVIVQENLESQSLF